MNSSSSLPSSQSLTPSQTNNWFLHWPLVHANWSGWQGLPYKNIRKKYKFKTNILSYDVIFNSSISIRSIALLMLTHYRFWVKRNKYWFYNNVYFMIIMNFFYSCINFFRLIKLRVNLSASKDQKSLLVDILQKSLYPNDFPSVRKNDP